MKTINKKFGFTIIELMITIAIVAILATIAIPAYYNYTRRAYYSEVVNASAPYVTAVAICYQHLGKVQGCDGGTNNIPENVTAPQGKVAALTVKDGVITVTPVADKGIESADTYILTATPQGTTLTWVSSGGGVTKGYAQ